MRNPNWMTIGVAVLMAGLLYYFFMQNDGCTKCSKGSHAGVSTSLDLDSQEHWEDADEYWQDIEEDELDEYFDEGLVDEPGKDA